LVGLGQLTGSILPLLEDKTTLVENNISIITEKKIITCDKGLACMMPNDDIAP